MSEVVQFVPRAGLEAKKNLAEFIRLAREDLIAFASGGAWDSDRWQQGKTVVVFATKTKPLGSYTRTPMAEPFKQFAKAYVRYKYSYHPVRSLDPVVCALRCIEAACLSIHDRADVLLLNGTLMDLSAEKCREFCGSQSLRYSVGRHLKAVFGFCRDSGFTSALPQWTPPFRNPAILTEDLGEVGQRYREKKLPSNTDMLQLADLFAQADDVESRYFTSIMILLMLVPSRISEVLVLPVDCIQWEEDDRGDRQMYLRWWSAKGKGLIKKWVVPAMHSVAVEAVERLIEIGAPARQAAKYAFEHPGRFMRHPGCITASDCDEDQPLTVGEFGAALGVGFHKGVRRGGRPNRSNINMNSRRNARLLSHDQVTYRDLAEDVLKVYGGYTWPFIDDRRTVKMWNALCLHREKEFHRSFNVEPFSWRLPSSTEVNGRMSARHHTSLFERYGMRTADGSSIMLTSHQLRHWLSTLSERAGMDDFTLAQWAGRADPKHNRHYDHRTSQERLDAARQLIGDEKPGLLERFRNRKPVTYQELGVDRLGTAKATLYGMCTHDYAMAPCQKQRECMTCKEHVCIKGDHVTLERIKVLEKQTALLLERAERAHKEGIFGADRWADNHKWKLAHVRAMRVTLEQADAPDGAIARIPEGHDPSAVKRALMDLGMTEPSDSAAAALPHVSQALTRGKDAEEDHH